jgi:hypothetical protein
MPSEFSVKLSQTRRVTWSWAQALAVATVKAIVNVPAKAGLLKSFMVPPMTATPSLQTRHSGMCQR